jgi:hypothetical protein
MLVAIGLGSWATSQPSREETLPLVLSPEVFDFGQVKRDKLSGEFRLTNESGEPIQILHVLTSCTCENIEVPRKRLEPGQAVPCKFTWDARRGQGESRISFQVVYKTLHEQKVRYARCVCRADVVAPFTFEPREFRFSPAAKEVQTAIVKFRASDKVDFAVTDARCLHRAFSTRCDPAKNEVIVSFDPSAWQKQDADLDLKVRVTTSVDPGVDCLVPVCVRE